MTRGMHVCRNAYRRCPEGGTTFAQTHGPAESRPLHVKQLQQTPPPPHARPIRITNCPDTGNCEPSQLSRTKQLDSGGHTDGTTLTLAHIRCPSSNYLTLSLGALGLGVGVRPPAGFVQELLRGLINSSRFTVLLELYTYADAGVKYRLRK